MNWKQKLADYFGYKNFEDMDTSDQRTAEKSVELYQKELNEKLKNVGLAVSDFSENERRKEIATKEKSSWDDWYKKFMQEVIARS